MYTEGSGSREGSNKFSSKGRRGNGSGSQPSSRNGSRKWATVGSSEDDPSRMRTHHHHHGNHSLNFDTDNPYPSSATEDHHSSFLINPNDEGDFQRVTFPSEWEMMMPDRADLIKESWKYTWRRIVFYVFFFALLVYLKNFPNEIQNFCVWIWVANILYYDLDITNSRTEYLVRFLHAPSMVGSFMVSIIASLQLKYDYTFLTERVQAAGNSVLMAWFLIAWMYFLPPVWTILDMYLHRQDLIDRHNLRLKVSSIRSLKLFRLCLQLLWNFTSTPILGAVWFLFGFSTDRFAWVFRAQFVSSVFFIVVVIANIIMALVMLFIIRRASAKKRTPIDEYNYERSTNSNVGDNEDSDYNGGFNHGDDNKISTATRLNSHLL